MKDVEVEVQWNEEAHAKVPADFRMRRAWCNDCNEPAQLWDFGSGARTWCGVCGRWTDEPFAIGGTVDDPEVMAQIWKDCDYIDKIMEEQQQREAAEEAAPPMGATDAELDWDMPVPDQQPALTWQKLRKNFQLEEDYEIARAQSCKPRFVRMEDGTIQPRWVTYHLCPTCGSGGQWKVAVKDTEADRYVSITCTGCGFKDSINAGYGFLKTQKLDADGIDI